MHVIYHVIVITNAHTCTDPHRRCLESSFLELSQQSQVALSNAAAQVSGGAGGSGSAGGAGMMGGHAGHGAHHGHHHHSSGLPSGEFSCIIHTQASLCLVFYAK